MSDDLPGRALTSEDMANWVRVDSEVVQPERRVPRFDLTKAEVTYISPEQIEKALGSITYGPPPRSRRMR